MTDRTDMAVHRIGLAPTEKQAAALAAHAAYAGPERPAAGRGGTIDGGGGIQPGNERPASPARLWRRNPRGARRRHDDGRGSAVRWMPVPALYRSRLDPPVSAHPSFGCAGPLQARHRQSAGDTAPGPARHVQAASSGPRNPSMTPFDLPPDRDRHPARSPAPVVREPASTPGSTAKTGTARSGASGASSQAEPREGSMKQPRNPADTPPIRCPPRTGPAGRPSRSPSPPGAGAADPAGVRQRRPAPPPDAGAAPGTPNRTRSQGPSSRRRSRQRA